jgi:hypothetical protein
MSGKISLFPD